MNALLRPTIRSLWLCSTRVSFGHVRSGPLDIVRSYAFGFLSLRAPSHSGASSPSLRAFMSNPG